MQHCEGRLSEPDGFMQRCMAATEQARRVHAKLRKATERARRVHATLHEGNSVNWMTRASSQRVDSEGQEGLSNIAKGDSVSEADEVKFGVLGA